jgi:hypothetical protein
MGILHQLARIPWEHYLQALKSGGAYSGELREGVKACPYEIVGVVSEVTTPTGQILSLGA